jgi:putative ABC transport system substrate-binding protein
MDRRTFVIQLVAAPAALRAQSTAPGLVGVLESRSSTRLVRRTFAQALLREGERLDVDVRPFYLASAGDAERLPTLADDLVRKGVNVIVVADVPSALAAKATSLPVVLAGVGDPVGARLVKSLVRPGGNITGVYLPLAEIHAQRLALLKAVVPRLRRIAALLDMSHPASMIEWHGLQAMARARQLDARLVDVRRDDDLDRALGIAVAARTQALVVGADGVIQPNLGRIAELALAHGLPSIHPAREYADLGGLLAYGANPLIAFREAAAFVGRLLGGARPADLPMEPVSRLQLVVNRRTARLLSIELPDDLIVRADAVVY